jgi:tetratricopeptide (TPR) repeat protein
MALFKEVIAADPEGKMGTTEYMKFQVPCTEYAEFSIAQYASSGQGTARSVEPMKAFIGKYPSSKLRRTAYSMLGSFYTSPRAAKEEAEKFFEDALAQYPDDPWMRYYYASRNTQTKDNLDRAIELAEGIQSFSSATSARMRAQLYALKGDLSRAEASYGPEFADGLISSLASSLSQYASFWIQQGKNLESAEKMLLTAVQLAPDNPYYRQSAANLFLQAGKTEKALEVFGPEFVKTAGTNANALTSYARFWVQKKQNLESAEAAVEEAMKLTPSDYYPLQTAADVFWQMGKQDRALAVFGPEYIRDLQDDPFALASYARFWASKKSNLESALAAAELAVKLPVELDLNRAYPWDTLASIYLALDRLEDALKAEEKAIEMDTAGYGTEYYKSNLKKIQDAIAKKKK